MQRGFATWLLTATMALAACGDAAHERVITSTATQPVTTSLAVATSTESTSPDTSVVTMSTLVAAGPLVVADTAAAVRTVLAAGEERAATATYRDHPITYVAPGTHATQVARVRYRADATLDVYYPPWYAFDELLPAVVFINAWSTARDAGEVLLLPDGTPMGEELGRDDYQNSSSFISMGNFVAASGMSGVVYGTRDDPFQDLDDAMSWLIANAADLGIDRSRIAVWMWSAHTLTGLRVVMEEGDWQDSVVAAVVYYGWMPYNDVEDAPPVHLVRALDDMDLFLDSQDRFLTVAQQLGATVDVVEIRGPHAFDRELGYEELTVAAFDTTLSYLEARFAGPD